MFSVDARLKDLMEEGGVAAFAKLARETLEKELEPLRAIEMMKKVTEAAVNVPAKTTAKAIESS